MISRRWLGFLGMWLGFLGITAIIYAHQSAGWFDGNGWSGCMLWRGICSDLEYEYWFSPVRTCESNTETWYFCNVVVHVQSWFGRNSRTLGLHKTYLTSAYLLQQDPSPPKDMAKYTNLTLHWSGRFAMHLNETSRDSAIHMHAASPSLWLLTPCGPVRCAASYLSDR